MTSSSCLQLGEREGAQKAPQGAGAWGHEKAGGGVGGGRTQLPGTPGPQGAGSSSHQRRGGAGELRETFPEADTGETPGEKWQGRSEYSVFT